MLKNMLAAALAFILAGLLFSQIAASVPLGASVTTISNDTATSAAAGLVNTTGGSITTIRLNGTSQNLRWKAYVGNASGKLSLDNSAGSSIYDWALTTITGEVYTTKTSGNVNWTGIGCANITQLETENANMNHTNRDDNISATFNAKNHTAFFIGTSQITANSCYSIHTYVNDAAQTQLFQEMPLYDAPASSGGNMVYVTTLEQDQLGFDNMAYDFQMIVPENGLAGWNSATAYYFYMELS